MVFCVDRALELCRIEVDRLQIVEIGQGLTAAFQQKEAAKVGEGGWTYKAQQHGR